MIESASKCRFLVMTVVFVLYVALPAGAWPECGDCERWNGDQCVPYGNCEGGCQNCYACAGCWCACASQCCEASDCGEPNCWSCVNCGCENLCTGSCQSCVDGSCKVCGGNPDQICCDGGCRPKCENTEPTNECDSSKTTECPGCFQCILWGGVCEGHYINVYTGNTVHSCIGGCAGDCNPSSVHCYTSYECQGELLYPCWFCQEGMLGKKCYDWGSLCPPLVGYCWQCNGRRMICEVVVPHKSCP